MSTRTSPGNLVIMTLHRTASAAFLGLVIALGATTAGVAQDAPKPKIESGPAAKQAEPQPQQPAGKQGGDAPAGGTLLVNNIARDHHGKRADVVQNTRACRQLKRRCDDGRASYCRRLKRDCK